MATKQSLPQRGTKGTKNKRRRRWLISAQGWERSDNPGITKQKDRFNPERVCFALNPFRVWSFINIDTQGCRCASNPGLKLANAFGVYFLCLLCLFVANSA